MTIDGTYAHRLWVRTVQGYEGWKPLSLINPSTDYIGVARGVADWGRSFFPSRTAYTLGVLVADGCLKRGKTTQTLQVDKQVPLLREIEPTIRHLMIMAGGRETSHVKITEVNDNHAYLTAHAPNFSKWLKANTGLQMVPSTDRFIPRSILSCDRKTIQWFLKGMFDGDGWCDKTAHYSTSSRQLAEQVLYLLTGLGVACGLREKPTDHAMAYDVVVYDQQAFADNVGFTPYGLTKDVQFARLLRTHRNTNVDLVPGVGRLIRNAALLLFSKHKRTDAWRRADSYYDGTGKMPSYRKLRQLTSALPEGSEKQDLDRIIKDHFFWCPVRSIVRSYSHRIDCEVPGSHSFIANGILNHNTVISATLPERLGMLPGEAMFFMAHRHELVDQAADKLRAYNPHLTVGVERATDRACPDSDIVVGSVQSLTAKRIRKFNPDRFRIIVCDEVHHSFTSKMYQEIFRYFGVHRSDARLDRRKLFLGISATWNRGDRKGSEHLFDKIVFHRSILDIMRSGIWVGDYWCPYLCPVKSDRQLTETNLDAVEVDRKKGDLQTGQLEKVVNTPERNNLIVDTYLEKGEGLRAIAFTVDIQHSHDLAKAFTDRGIPFAPISGETSREERKRIFADYQAGYLRGLASCGVLSEGTDLPWAAVGLNAKPTLSPVVYTQAFGRITRPYPSPEDRQKAFSEGKTWQWIKRHGIWIDFTDSSTKHNLIQAPMLFGLRPDFDFRGKSMEETVKAIEEAKEKNPSLDLKNVRSLDDLTRSSVAFESTAAVQEDVDIRKWSVYPWQKETSDQWALPIRGTSSVLRVKQEEEDAFVVWQYVMGAGKPAKKETTLRKAIQAADRLLTKKEKKLLQRDAPWRREPPTQAQCVALWQIEGKNGKLHKEYRSHEDFYRHCVREYDKGNMEFSKGTIGDAYKSHLVANRFRGRAASAGVRRR